MECNGLDLNMRSRFATSNRGAVYPVYKQPVIIDEDDVKQRPIHAGETINVLCMLGIWEFCVETVVALENGDSYMINSKDFIDNFSSHSVFEVLRDHTAKTMFEMVKDPDAPTKHGVPLYPYREEEVILRDAEYSKKKSIEKNASYRQLTLNMKLKLKAQKIKETDKVNTFISLYTVFLLLLLVFCSFLLRRLLLLLSLSISCILIRIHYTLL